ncbi:MAG: hypothetical protein GY775_16770 [Candidatus Scalindua sp.]|nr:hypothetical protein [Candidatus Scalindua sp.]
MLDFKKLKVGSILSETSYFTVTDKTSSSITVKDSHGNEGLDINKNYCEKILNSSDQFESTEKCTQTQLSEIATGNNNIAMEIYFKKADKKKTKKAYKEDLETQATQVSKDFMAKGISAIIDALKTPVLDYTLGEMRLIKGYSLGSLDAHGRLNFCDLEDEKNLVKGVDVRTIEYIIVNNVKYIKK